MFYTCQSDILEICKRLRYTECCGLIIHILCESNKIFVRRTTDVVLQGLNQCHLCFLAFIMSRRFF
jgi:hypothetical protein